jgi:hypothetical protein
MNDKELYKSKVKRKERVDRLENVFNDDRHGDFARELLIEARRQGYTIKEIAGMFDTSITVILYNIKKLRKRGVNCDKT